MSQLFIPFILYNITSMPSILVLSFGLVFRIKYIQKELDEYERIILGICISDLIFEFGQLISIYLYNTYFLFPVALAVIMGISICYSTFTTLMIAYISWQDISNIKFQMQMEYKYIVRRIQMFSFLYNMIQFFFILKWFVGEQYTYTIFSTIGLMIVILPFLIYYYTKVVYEINERGAKLSLKLLQIYKYPLIIILTLLPGQILYLIYLYNNQQIYAYLGVNVHNLIGLFDGLVYGSGIYYKHKEINTENVSMDICLESSNNYVKNTSSKSINQPE